MKHPQVRDRSHFRPRFSLRTSIIGITACCAAAAWVAWRSEQAQREALALTKLHNSVSELYQDYPFYTDNKLQPISDLVKVKYDYQYDWDGTFNPNRNPWTPRLLQGELGGNSLAQVVSLEISTHYEYDDGNGVMMDGYALCKLPSLDFLLEFPKLRELTLDIGLQPDTDLSALGKLEQLQRLSFSSPRMEKKENSYLNHGLDLASIRSAKNLKYLKLRGAITPAESRPSFLLEELELFAPNRDDMPSLRSFGDLSQLESLSLISYGKRIDSTIITSSLPSLTRLKIGGCEIQNLDAFSDSPIEELHLNNCRKLKEISVLRDSKTLRKLEIAFWSHRHSKLDFDTSSMRYPALEEANFSGALESIDFLKSSPRLKSLILYDREITDVSSLEQNRQLNVLKLNCPKLKGLKCDLDQVRELTMQVHPDLSHFDILSSDESQLERLELRRPNNAQLKLDDLTCLKHAKGLRCLKLVGLSISDIDFLNSDQLEQVSLKKNHELSSIDGLKNQMDTLRELHIYGNVKLLNHSVLALPSPNLKELTVSNLDYSSSGTTIDRLANHPIKLNPTQKFEILVVPGHKPVNQKAWEEKRWDDYHLKDLRGYIR